MSDINTVKNIANELADEYAQSKYSKKHLKERIQKILEFIIPGIAILAKNKDNKSAIEIWNDIKNDEKIKDLFKKSIENIERPIVIYVASKFKNNQYFGAIIIKEALIWA